MKLKIFLIPILLFTLFHVQALAYSPIVHEFHSVRAEGMGNVKYVTGLYEENFFANPARATDNPENMFQLPKISIEIGSGATSAISKSSGGLSAFSDSVGKPLSGSFQMIFPAYYNREFLTDYWSLAVGMLTSVQTVFELSQAGNIDPTTMITAGPAFTLGRRLLDEHRLSVGLTARTEFRGNSRSSYSVAEYLSGTKIADVIKGGNGFGVDFDIGTTFKPHWNLLGFEYQVGFAIDNLLNGQYKNIAKPISSWGSNPFQSKRTYNFGVSATKTEVFFLDSVLFAIDFSDFGNNENGSIYRTLHVGSEVEWKSLTVRTGINQGYFCGGFGLDLGFFDVNLATYGEELGLNPGVMEDRRYALEFGFQI